MRFKKKLIRKISTLWIVNGYFLDEQKIVKVQEIIAPKEVIAMRYSTSNPFLIPLKIITVNISSY
jgi:hypothetical protein